jgi:glycosyltransferase involved in cell wall biosynthesis
MVAVSHSVARAFCGNFSFSGRVETIYNGTDLSCFPPKAAGSSVFRQEAGIPDDAFLVCAVGQICVRKGLLELVNAFATIYAEVPLMHLAIVGKVVFAHEEEYQKVLIRTAITAGVADRVHFMGERKDVSSILQASDLLVLNSREEPFGLVLVEAMASGTPVLATRVGGVPEVVRDSENGWLIESGDTGALAAKLLELSQHVDQLDQAARFGREFTCPQFSIERFRRNLHRLYAELGDEAASKSNPRALTALTPHEGEKGVSDA